MNPHLDHKNYLLDLAKRIGVDADQLSTLIPRESFSFHQRRIEVTLEKSGVTGVMWSYGLRAKSHHRSSAGLPDALIYETWRFRETGSSLSHVARTSSGIELTTLPYGTGMVSIDGVSHDDCDYDYLLVTDWAAATKLLGQPIGYAANEVPSPHRFYDRFLSSYAATKQPTVMAGWKDTFGHELWAEVPPDVHVPTIT